MVPTLRETNYLNAARKYVILKFSKTRDIYFFTSPRSHFMSELGLIWSDIKYELYINGSAISTGE